MVGSKTEPAGVSVNAGSYKGSLYSQFVVVTVSDVDINLEFVYINPRDKRQGEVVSRITLPRLAGRELAETIIKTIAEHEAKKGPRN